MRLRNAVGIHSRGLMAKLQSHAQLRAALSKLFPQPNNAPGHMHEQCTDIDFSYKQYTHVHTYVATCK